MCHQFKSGRADLWNYFLVSANLSLFLLAKSTSEPSSEASGRLGQPYAWLVGALIKQEWGKRARGRHAVCACSCCALLIASRCYNYFKNQLRERALWACSIHYFRIRMRTNFSPRASIKKESCRRKVKKQTPLFVFLVGRIFRFGVAGCMEKS